jgi:CubicO group peptidase (beta-lactamase class C family)
MRHCRSSAVLVLLTAVAGAPPVAAQLSAPIAGSHAQAPDLRSRVDAAVGAAMEREHLPAVSVGIQLGAEVLIARGYGLADLENDVPASERTVYRIGSITNAYGELLRPETWRRMSTPGKLANSDPIDYGYGVMAGELSGRAKIAHGGGINGFRSQLAYYPAEELIVVVLANTGTARVDALERTLARLVLGIPEPEGDDAGPPQAKPEQPKSETPKPEPPEPVPTKPSG